MSVTASGLYSVGFQQPLNILANPLETSSQKNATLESSFFDQEIIESLEASGVLSNGALTSDLSLPPCTEKQTDTFVDLIESPFDFVDHEGTTVLSGLNSKELLSFVLNDPLFKKLKIDDQEKIQLAGSSVWSILESDPEWIKSGLIEILKDNYDLIAPSHKRPPKDLDLHVICKKGSITARSELINRLLHELGKRAVIHNRVYIEREIEKIKALPDDPKDKALSILKDEIAIYETAVKEGALGELIEISFIAIAKSVVQKNCLKKFSDNQFGTIISFELFELVLSEKTDYLLTQDRLVITFQKEIKKGTSERISISPNDRKGVESLLHRKLKMAYIDLVPTEYTFPKACAYLSFGNYVPQDKIFIDALNNYTKLISSKGLIKNGLDVIERFGKNQLKETPEEALCILLNMFRFFKQNKNDDLILFMIEKLHKYLSKPLKVPLLNAVRQLLIAHPKDYELLSASLQILPAARKVSHETWILFKDSNGTKHYVIRQTFNPNAFEELAAHTDKELVSTFLNKLIESNHEDYSESLSKVYLEKISSWNEIPELRYSAFILLLNNPHTSLNYFLTTFPSIYIRLEHQQQNDFIQKTSLKINDSDLSRVFDEFKKDPCLEAWIILLADYPKFTLCAYTLWNNTAKENLPFSIQFAETLLQSNIEYAFKVIRGILIPFYDKTTIDLETKVYACLENLLITNSPLLNKELCSVLRDVTIWVVNSELKQGNYDKVKNLLELLKVSFPVMSWLILCKENVWAVLSEEDSIILCQESSTAGNLSLLSEGLQHLNRKQLSSSQRVSLLKNLLTVKDSLTKEKAENVLYLLQRFIYLLQKKDLEKSEEELGYLFELVCICGELFKDSNSYIFFQPYQSVLSLFFGISFLQVIKTGLDLNRIVKKIIEILSEKISPVKGCQPSFSLFVNELVKHLKKEKKEEEVNKIIYALDLSCTSITECSEIGEYRYQLQLKSMDARVLSDNDIHKFLQGLEEKPEKEIEKEILKFCERLLKENQFLKLQAFISGLVAFSYQKHLVKASNTILTHLKTINKADSFLDLLKVVLERKLHEFNRKEYKKIISTFQKSLVKKDVQKHWSFLYRLIDYFPEQRQEILPLLFEHISQKHFDYIESYWLMEIDAETYGGLDFAQASSCTQKYITLLCSFKTKRTISLIVHLEKINKILEKTLDRKQRALFACKWITFCHEVLQDAALATKEENLLLGQLMNYVISQKDPESIRAVYWSGVRFALYSKNLSFCFASLKSLEKKESYLIESEFESFREVIQEILGRLNNFTEEALLTSYVNYLLDLSQRCRLSTSQNSIERYLLKNILPFFWMKGLACIVGVEPVLEAFEWFKLHLKNLTPHVEKSKANEDTKKNRYVVLQKEAKDIAKYLLKTIINEPSTHNPVRFKEITDILCLLGKNNEYYTIWQTYISLLLNNFYADPSGVSNFNSSHLIYTWSGATHNCTIACPEIDEKKFIKSLISLLYGDQIILAALIWNEIFLAKPEHCNSAKVYYGSEEGIVTQFLFVKESAIERLDRTQRIHYILHLNEWIAQLCASIARGKCEKPGTTICIYNLVANCLYELFALCEKQPDIQPSGIELFSGFLNIIRPGDPEFVVHIKKVCPPLFGMLSRFSQGYRNDPIYAEHYVRLLLCCGQKPEVVSVKISKFDINCATSAIIAAISGEETNISLINYANILYHIINERLVLDSNCHLYLSCLLKILKKCDLSKVLIEDQHFLSIISKNLEKLESLINSEKDPSILMKSVFRLVGDYYTSMIGTDSTPLLVRKIYLMNTIDWLYSFKCSFNDFTLEYEAYLNKFKTAFGKFGVLPIHELKAIHDKFMLWLTDFPFELSSVGRERRALFINSWLSLMDLEILESKYLYKVTLLFCEKNEIYRGLEQLHTDAKKILPASK